MRKLSLKSPRAVKMAINEGMSPDGYIKDKEGVGYTLLSACCQMGFEDSAKALLALGADPNAWCHADSGEDRLPLHYAIDNRSEALVKALVAAGADLSERDGEYMMYPFSLAACSGNPVVLDTLLRARPDLMVSETNKDGSSPLHHALTVDCAETLLQHGAQMEKADARGLTPLTHHAKMNHWGLVSFLTGKGADVCVADVDGWSPLHFLASSEPSWRDKETPLRAISLVLDAGADPTAVTKDGKTAMDVAGPSAREAIAAHLASKEREALRQCAAEAVLPSRGRRI